MNNTSLTNITVNSENSETYS